MESILEILLVVGMIVGIRFGISPEAVEYFVGFVCLTVALGAAFRSAMRDARMRVRSTSPFYRGRPSRN